MVTVSSGAGDRPSASSGALAGRSAEGDKSPSRKATLRRGKATLRERRGDGFVAYGDTWWRKVTLLPPKVTVSAHFAPEHCQGRQHRAALSARPEEVAKRPSRRMPLAPRAAFRKSASR
jgi:hypothetical protein